MNRKFAIDKQETIKSMCLSICKHGHLADDLAQWVSIYFLTHEIEEVNLTDGLIYSVAWKGYNLRGSEFKREHNPITFQYSDLTDSELEIALNFDTINVDEDYKQTLKDLNSVEKTWIEEIVKRNLSINLFSEHTNISRAKATERMNAIYNKLRKFNEK